MPDPLKAWIRTVWPGFVSYLTALLVTWAGAKLGVDVNTNLTFGAVTVILLGVIYGLGRWLEQRPERAAKTAGRWLVSLGVDLGQPTYPTGVGGRGGTSSFGAEVITTGGGSPTPPRPSS